MRPPASDAGEGLGPSPPTTGGSRVSERGAGWRCRTPGAFERRWREAQRYLPRRDRGRPLSWKAPRTLLAARNEILAKLSDPGDDQRRAWVAARVRAGVPAHLIVDRRDLEAPSFVVLGDTGEGDRSQFAVVPPLEAMAEGTDFLVICGDVVYPAGDVNEYVGKFHEPYGSQPRPIYAVPGNHDWDDGGLEGFMLHLCGAEAAPPEVARAVPRWLRATLWRRPRRASATALERARARHASPATRSGQPGPYFALQTGPLLLVGIDTGFGRRIDREQARWLRDVSLRPGPKILISSRPLYVDGRREPGEIEDAPCESIDDIVRRPEHGYIAAIGGDVHNYQRYPVTVEGGRVVQYIVNGGGGAFTSGTHTVDRIDIPNVDPALPPTREEDARLYPLRGDSLAFFSQLYDEKLRSRSMVARLVASPRLGGQREGVCIPRRVARRLMGERYGIPTRDLEDVRVETHHRAAARIVLRLPSGPHGRRVYYSLWDWDHPPFFKSFIRVDAGADRVRIRCVAVTGCGEHEAAPPLEDDVTWSAATGEWVVAGRRGAEEQGAARSSGEG